MKFALTILGVNAATPAFGRFPSAQVLQVHHHFFLIDCGEGTQMRMSDFDIPRHKINHIFISHLHGDHVFGLPGLLFSFDLMGRNTPLNIYSPKGLKEMVMAQLNPGGQLTFPLVFHELNTHQPGCIFENEILQVHTVPLRHRIPTAGFVFREKLRPRNVIPEKIKEYDLSIAQIKAAKAGENILLEDGRFIPNPELTLNPPKPRSYAYVSDTLFDETIVPYLKKVDLLYHETTFCEDFADNAALTMHATAKQAATIAKLANVGQLITGHYSSRYQDLQKFSEEAKGIFPNVLLGKEGVVYEVPLSNEPDSNRP